MLISEPGCGPNLGRWACPSPEEQNDAEKSPDASRGRLKQLIWRERVRHGPLSVRTRRGSDVIELLPLKRVVNRLRILEELDCRLNDAIDNARIAGDLEAGKLALESRAEHIQPGLRNLQHGT